MNTDQEVFESEVDFCEDCGSILPLPDVEELLFCLCCGKEADPTAFDGRTVETEIYFNAPKILQQGLQSSNFEGPEVERKCPRCDNDVMTFATRQTRSADEGQTVFFTCPRCRFQEIEYS